MSYMVIILVKDWYEHLLHGHCHLSNFTIIHIIFLEEYCTGFPFAALFTQRIYINSVLFFIF